MKGHTNWASEVVTMRSHALYGTPCHLTDTAGEDPDTERPCYQAAPTRPTASAS